MYTAYVKTGFNTHTALYANNTLESCKFVEGGWGQFSGFLDVLLLLMISVQFISTQDNILHLCNGYKPKNVHSVRYFTVRERYMTDKMGTFCQILYNSIRLRTIFDRMGSLRFITYIKIVYSLLMNSFDDRSASFYLLGTIHLVNNKHLDKTARFWLGT